MEVLAPAEERKFVDDAEVLGSTPDPVACGVVVLGSRFEDSGKTLAVALEADKGDAYCSVLVSVRWDVHGSREEADADDDGVDDEVGVGAGDELADSSELTIVASVNVFTSAAEVPATLGVGITLTSDAVVVGSATATAATGYSAGNKLFTSPGSAWYHSGS
jgi:hypothetical protein